MKKIYILLTFIVLVQVVFGRNVTDTQLTPSQKEMLEALTIEDPEIDYHHKGVKGFYDYYKGRTRIQVWADENRKMKIVDISLFATLRSIEDLEFQNCDITDFSCLSKLPNLRRLTINKNFVEINFASIAAIKNLEILRFDDYKYFTESQIQAIGQLKKLRIIDFSHCNLGDISSLAKIKTLKEIEITSCQIKQIGDWQSIDSLRIVDIMFCDLESTSFIKNCKGITFLTLSGNKIKELDISWHSLEFLSVADNLISSIDGIEKGINLEYLNLNNNQIVDISPLIHLKKLQELQIWHNEITDLTPLSKITSLQKLDVSNNPFTDASCINALPDLISFQGHSRSAYPCSPENKSELKEDCHCNAFETSLYSVLMGHPLVIFILVIGGVIARVVYRRKKFPKVKTIFVPKEPLRKSKIHRYVQYIIFLPIYLIWSIIFFGVFMRLLPGVISGLLFLSTVFNLNQFLWNGILYVFLVKSVFRVSWLKSFSKAYFILIVSSVASILLLMLLSFIGKVYLSKEFLDTMKGDSDMEDLFILGFVIAQGITLVMSLVVFEIYYRRYRRRFLTVPIKEGEG